MTINQGRPIPAKMSECPAIGILMLNTAFPRLLGDIGHPDTFSYPVARMVVKRAHSGNVVLSDDSSLAEDFALSAQELEEAGAKAIVTSCGFLARYQKIISESVSIPVATSSLLLLPLIKRIIGPKKSIGVLTANAATLSAPNFQECGASDIPVSVLGMEGSEFYRVYVGNATNPDIEKIKAELKEKVVLMKRSTPNVGAILLECTNMPPFRDEIQKAAGLPVFDVRSLVDFVHTGICQDSREL